MKYALLIYSGPQAHAEPGADQRSTDDDVFESYLDYTRALKQSGALLGFERLEAEDTATTVRLQGGERLLTDGPFIETKEHLLGFYLIEAPDLDTAIDWAARMPHMRHGAVEVRPVMPIPNLAQIASE
jgi:hypothetical protein